nr:uncharacterized protein LOC129385650 [Dermacentor andersoni]
MLLGVIVVLLVNRGRANAGALVAGADVNDDPCGTTSRPARFVHTTSGRRKPRTKRVSRTSVRATPWCDEVQRRSTLRRRCRTRPGRSTQPMTTPTHSVTSSAAAMTTTATAEPSSEKSKRPEPVMPRTRPTRHASNVTGGGRSTSHATTTTRMPLVCTVGSKGAAFSMFPPAGMCSHVFFTHVLVSDGALHASGDGGAWEDFVRTMQAEEFADYPAGISFDMRYSMTSTFMDNPMIRKELKELATGTNIKHYGILNVVTRAAQLTYLVAAAGTLITKLRQLQEGDRSRHIVVAAGLYTYNELSAWTTYQAQFHVLAGLDVDILISISSVGTMESDKICFAAPPTVWNSTNAVFLGFEKHSTLLLASESYLRKELYVGLSFEMGVTMYQLKNVSTLPEKALYAPCTDFTLVGYEQVCDPHVKLTRMDDLPVEFGATSTSVFFYDSWETMKRKVDRVLSLPVRNKIAWLLFDTHLSDVTWECSASWEREQKLQEYLATFA